MNELTKKEIGEIFMNFLDQNGLWYVFKDYIDNQGYSTEDLGIEDED